MHSKSQLTYVLDIPLLTPVEHVFKKYDPTLINGFVIKLVYYDTPQDGVKECLRLVAIGIKPVKNEERAILISKKFNIVLGPIVRGEPRKTVLSLPELLNKLLEFSRLEIDLRNIIHLGQGVLLVTCDSFDSSIPDIIKNEMIAKQACLAEVKYALKASLTEFLNPNDTLYLATCVILKNLQETLLADNEFNDLLTTGKLKLKVKGSRSLGFTLRSMICDGTFQKYGVGGDNDVEFMLYDSQMSKDEHDAIMARFLKIQRTVALSHIDFLCDIVKSNFAGSQAWIGQQSFIQNISFVERNSTLIKRFINDSCIVCPLSSSKKIVHYTEQVNKFDEGLGINAFNLGRIMCKFEVYLWNYPVPISAKAEIMDIGFRMYDDYLRIGDFMKNVNVADIHITF